MHRIRQIILWVIKVPALLLYGLISVYQRTLSPDHGLLRFFFPHGYCKFHPTCSEYSKKALLKYGLFKGLYLTVHRILRCNPWNEGGVDKP